MKRKPINAGEIFGRLTVLGPADTYVIPNGNNIYCVRCRCECGNESIVYESKLRFGSTKSCGCLEAETKLKNTPPRITHGMTIGLKRTPTYRSWRAMHDRCLYPSTNGYERYGGAGITICERWNKFENFLEDMGERPDGTSIDRKLSTGNYEPGNCKWSTPIEQESNRRDTIFVVLHGEKIHAAEAARRLGVKDYRLRQIAYRRGSYQAAVDEFAAKAAAMAVLNFI